VTSDFSTRAALKKVPVRQAVVAIQLSEPEGDSGEFDEAHEVCEQLVVSGGDAAELFELVEEALNEGCSAGHTAAWPSSHRAMFTTVSR
jgi:hypothetical protein